MQTTYTLSDFYVDTDAQNQLGCRATACTPNSRTSTRRTSPLSPA